MPTTFLPHLYFVIFKKSSGKKGQKRPDIFAFMCATRATASGSGGGVIKVATRLFGSLPNGVSKAVTKTYFKSMGCWQFQTFSKFVF